MAVENIPISQLTEATTAADSDVIAIDNGTTTKKITVENFNATGTASAKAYAEAAADSATAAADSASDALGYKNTVQSALNDASTIVSNAQSYANSAESSKNDASGFASSASTSASQASTSAGQAASYATGVQAYAVEAKSWAEGGTGTRVDEETTNCEYYANAAHTSETNAAASESNAATSESNAASSESNASASASSASTNALKAEGYAVGSQNGTPAASGETYYHDNAKYYKEEAATSATNAGTSETNAGLSASAASGSATAAKGSEEDSEAWAWGKIDGVDVLPTHPAYHNNAKYYADQASGGVSGVSSWNARSGNVVPESGDYAASEIEYDNTTSGLIADDVQEAIDEVLGEVSSLATVATTGDYSDLINTPNLATVATSGSYSDLSNKPTLGTAAALDVPVSGNASTSEVVKGDDSRLTDSRTPTSHTHTTSDITDYPSLATVATSGSYTDLTNKPTIPDATSIGYTGTASSSGVRYQRVGIGSAYTEINGTKYMEQTKTLSTSADVTYTFSNAAITTDSVIDPYASIFGIVPKSITVSSGSCSVVIPKYTSASSCKVRIYIK